MTPRLFAKTEDPQFEGHSILELYETQITGALSPAFQLVSSPPAVTVLCCGVVAAWGASGVGAEPSRTRRYVPFLTQTLPNLHTLSYANYGDFEVTNVSVAILATVARLLVLHEVYSL